jgi:hypothetical protein
MSKPIAERPATQVVPDPANDKHRYRHFSVEEGS